MFSLEVVTGWQSIYIWSLLPLNPLIAPLTLLKIAGPAGACTLENGLIIFFRVAIVSLFNEIAFSFPNIIQFVVS